MKLSCGFTCIAAFLCALFAPDGGARTDLESKRAVLRVTLNATVTKTWNTVTETTSGGCAVSIHSIGTRKVVLRSLRPTSVLVTASRGRVSYRPALARFVRAEVTGSGSQTTTFEPPCVDPTEHIDCKRTRSVLRGATFRFFRSRRNEIAFRPARLPGVAGSCPWQSADLREIEPGLQDAEGELSEAALMNPRIRAQTALASAEIESEFDGDETGRAIERVSWSLTFRR